MFISTRGNPEKLTASQAILKGIAEDGGLYIPTEFSKFSKLDISNLCDLDYKGRAKYILKELLDDFTEDEISDCVEKAYGNNKFPKEVAPLKPVDDNLWSLELWHGPTCAFKDMALQILPHLMTVAMKKNNINKKILIIAATSGDTGKAALEGFKDVENTHVITFFPEEGVSKVQKLQMTTQEGNNVDVYGVYGNFDMVQGEVKVALTNQETIDEIDKKGYRFSSANSINWGRLAPQVVYYFSAYCDLVNAGFISIGDKVDFCVPTGNFGNILAGYYASKMGLPVNKLICASNSNNILTEFIETGKYSRARVFKITISPSMDILISSNLERLLYELLDGDAETLVKHVADIRKKSDYSITEAETKKLQEMFMGECMDDEETMAEIKRRYEKGYLCDPHTAVAMGVYEKIGNKDIPTVIVSTADPYKFNAPVLKAIGAPVEDNMNEFQLIELMEKVTHVKPPKQIAELSEKEVRFSEKILGSGIRKMVANV